MANTKPYNLRLPVEIITAVEMFAREKQITSTTVIITALKTFLINNKYVDTPELKVLINSVERVSARENTKQEMAKIMFLHNARKRIARMFKDGIYNQEKFKDLLKVWVKEAEANGVEADVFLQEIKKGIGGVKYE